MLDRNVEKQGGCIREFNKMFNFLSGKYYFLRVKYGDWIDCIPIFEYNTTVFLYCSSGGKASESRS